MSHSAANFCQEILLFLIKVLVAKGFMDEKGGITFFHRNFFVSQYRKISLWSTSVYRKTSGIEKFDASERGVSRFSVENFWSHSAEKLRKGTH